MLTMKPSRHPSALTVKPNGLTISAPVDINEAQCHRPSNYSSSPPSSLCARKREMRKVYVCLIFEKCFLKILVVKNFAKFYMVLTWSTKNSFRLTKIL